MPPMLNIPTKPETKPAVQSSVLWGLTMIAIPYLSDAIKYLGALPPGVIPTPVTYGLTAAGWLLALYGRLYGTNKPISGIVTTKK